jgi:sugar/nucleoside kinase (ribokinase family)
MARLLTNSQDTNLPPTPRPLRIIAVGTLFLTHTLWLPTYPSPSTVTRAHSVSNARGGSASCLLSLLAQFNGAPGLIDPQLVAPLGGNEEGKMIMRELEREGVGIRYCKVWKGAGVPTAWILKSGASAGFRRSS